MGEVVQLGQHRQTGPRTERGKRRSSMNALRHGAHARSTIIAGIEDPAEFEALFRAVVAFHDIEDPVTLLAAERLISVAWRLRRVRRIEAEKLSKKAAQYTRDCEKLEALRQDLMRFTAWLVALPSPTDDGLVEPQAVSSMVELTRFCLDGHEDVTFGTKRLDRMMRSNRRIRTCTVLDALDEALDALRPTQFAGVTPGTLVASADDLIETLVAAVATWAKSASKEIEELEQHVARSLIGSLELNWQDERSLSEAERRLDSQFTRALHDFHAARAAAEQPFSSSTAEKRRLPVASGSGSALPDRG